MHRLLLVGLTIALLSLSALGQGAPTLRIVTEDPTLPSDLFYGTARVKPLRLRPGTNTPITIDDSDFFVQQQYIDFLSRFPESGGFAAWLNVLAGCNGDRNCLDGENGRRVEVSKSFFQSEEFQLKGYFVYRFYKASLGRQPLYVEIIPDMRSVTGTTTVEVEQKRTAFSDAWVQRAEFLQKYPTTLSPTAYVDGILQTASITVSNRAQLIADLTSGAKTRAQVLRAIVESPEEFNKEYDPAFVAMQYFGYLRRDPEPEGYNNWLVYLAAHPGDYKHMVWGFAYSTEYRNRF